MLASYLLTTTGTKKMYSLLLPLNEQRITYDESFKDEHCLKFGMGEQIALQTISVETQEISSDGFTCLKRGLKLILLEPF